MRSVSVLSVIIVCNTNIDVVEQKFALNNDLRVRLVFWGAIARKMNLEVSAFSRISLTASAIIRTGLMELGLRARRVGSLCSHNVFRSGRFL